MNAIGAQELSMPLVQPAHPWIATTRYHEIDEELVRFDDRFGRQMVLAMTHEEVITMVAQRILHSYKQLPMLVYQIQTKFRDELRPRMGLVRVREFSMKDSYSFDLDQKGLQAQYDAHYKAYLQIFKRAGLDNVVVVESNSGIMGGKRSHEFMYLSKYGEDKLILCQSCGLSSNIDATATVNSTEVIGELRCPRCKAITELQRGIEVANIFQLGDRYTKALGVTVTNSVGENITPLMGSYGIGIGRLLACLAEEYHDDRGLKLPREVAPHMLSLVSLPGSSDRIRLVADSLYEELLSANIDVLYDDRELPAGVKFADADLIRTPFIVTISECSLRNGGVEVQFRDTGIKHIIEPSALQGFISAAASVCGGD